jgi:predicted ATPase with chaperone activity
MLAKRMPTILPDPTTSESIETTQIYSALGWLKPVQPLLAVRPFRSPHDTIGNAGLVGGGSTPSPGEERPPERSRSTGSLSAVERSSLSRPPIRCAARWRR